MTVYHWIDLGVVLVASAVTYYITILYSKGDKK